ncbi:MAG: CPBP family intramembrane glutamic endopeptidase [Acidimicrobiales bacterium]
MAVAPSGDSSTPGARATPNRWGLPEALAGFAVGLVISGIAVSLAEVVVGAGRRGQLPVPVTVTGVAGLWVGLVGAAAWASRRRGSGSLVRDFGWRVGGWLDVVGGAAVGLACQYGLIPLMYLPFEHLDPSLRRQLSQPAQTDTGAAHGVVPVVVLLLVLAVGAPVVEELFFRGLLLRALLGAVPAPVAVVLTGVLFGLAHFEALQFAGLAVFGMVLAVLARQTGRLGPGMAAHAAFNASAVLTLAHLR